MLNGAMIGLLLLQSSPAISSTPVSRPDNSETHKPVEFESRGSQVIVFPVKWLKAINAALDRFSRMHRNFECYRIIMTEQPDSLEINFSSPLVTSRAKGSDVIAIGPESKCGPGESYLVRLNGKIVRRISPN